MGHDNQVQPQVLQQDFNIPTSHGSTGRGLGAMPEFPAHTGSGNTKGQQRNILILGKVGVGKSTIANHILGKSDAEARGPMEGVTRRSQALRIIPGQGPGGTKCKVMIIDISAQYDRMPRTQLIEDLRSACSEPLNLVLFVVQKGRITQAERKAFEEIVPKFPTAITSLVITFCEDLDPQSRAEAIQIFREDDFSKQTARHFRNVYTVGFPNLNKIKLRMREVYKEGIDEDERILRDIVCKAESPKPIDLQLSQSGCRHQ